MCVCGIGPYQLPNITASEKSRSRLALHHICSQPLGGTYKPKSPLSFPSPRLFPNKRSSSALVCRRSTRRRNNGSLRWRIRLQSQPALMTRLRTDVIMFFASSVSRLPPLLSVHLLSIPRFRRLDGHQPPEQSQPAGVRDWDGANPRTEQHLKRPLYACPDSFPSVILS